MTNHTQCVIVSVVDDNVLENSEEFLLQAENTSLVTPSPSIVTITIVDNDCKDTPFTYRRDIHVLFFSAAVIAFSDTSYQVTEPGTVEVGVELVGNLSFGIDLKVDMDINSTTANGIELAVNNSLTSSIIVAFAHTLRWDGLHRFAIQHYIH